MWVEISRDEFHKIIEENGGIDNLKVYGAYSEIPGFVKINKTGIVTEYVFYTEWGTKDGVMPLVSERKHGDVWTFRKWTGTEEEYS